MTGHNSGGTALHQLNSAIAGLGLALQDLRTTSKHKREQMVIVARHLLAVDEAAADDEVLADAEIKRAGITLPTDAIASGKERTLARWMARGGVVQGAKPGFLLSKAKNPNEIKDLSPGGLNGIEGAFLTRNKFAKAFTYGTVNSLLASECRSEIRKAVSGTGGFSLDGIRGTYAGTLFMEETVEAWIKDAEYKASDEYQSYQVMKQAVGAELTAAETDMATRQRLEEFFKQSMTKIRAMHAQERAEKEAKAADAAKKLTVDQRRTVAKGLQSLEGEEGATDADF